MKRLASGSQQFVTFKFDFITEDWDGMSVTAFFAQNGEEYGQILKQGSSAATIDHTNSSVYYAYMPTQIEPGECIVTLRGSRGTSPDYVIGTTNFVKLIINDYGVSDDELNRDITPTLYEQLREELAIAVYMVLSPVIVSAASNMTDHDTVYVYAGSESGYTNGHWYYYNSSSSAWVDGGAYTELSLSVATVAETKTFLGIS